MLFLFVAMAAILAAVTLVALFFMGYDAEKWFLRRHNRDELPAERVAVLEDHRSAEDGSQDYTE